VSIIGFTAENSANKGQNNGYASLDANGLVPNSELPSLVISHPYPVANLSAMLALSANVGDVAIRADSGTNFILRATPATSYGNWLKMAGGIISVTSVNGKSGVVSLTWADVGAIALTDSVLFARKVDVNYLLTLKQNNLGFTPENTSNKATNFSTVNNTLYPSVQAAKTYADTKYAGLPTQTGNSGKFLYTNGTSESWRSISPYPDSIRTGRYLFDNFLSFPFMSNPGFAMRKDSMWFYNGSTWQLISNSLSYNAGYAIKITGSNPASINVDTPILRKQIKRDTSLYSFNSANSKLIQGKDTSWIKLQGGQLPSQSGNSGKFLSTNGSAASWKVVPSSTDLTGIFKNINGKITPYDTSKSGAFNNTGIKPTQTDSILVYEGVFNSANIFTDGTNTNIGEAGQSINGTATYNTNVGEGGQLNISYGQDNANVGILGQVSLNGGNRNTNLGDEGQEGIITANDNNNLGHQGQQNLHKNSSRNISIGSGNKSKWFENDMLRIDSHSDTIFTFIVANMNDSQDTIRFNVKKAAFGEGGKAVIIQNGLILITNNLGVVTDTLCSLAYARAHGSGGGSMVYPGAGVPNSTGTAWGTSYTVGTGNNNLVQLNGSGQLPAVDGHNLTGIVTTIDTTKTNALGHYATQNDVMQKQNKGNYLLPSNISGLSTRISNDSSHLVTINSSLSTRISNDSTKRISGVSGLSARITNDSSHLININTSLSSRITADSLHLKNINTSLSSRIAADSTNTASKLSVETDPVVKAINGIVKSNGSTISTAVADSEYVKPAIPEDSVRTSNFTAQADRLYRIDNTSRNIVVTLVSAPASGTRITLKDVTFSTSKTIIINTGGSDVLNTVSGSTSTSLLTQGHAITFQYKISQKIWVITGTGAPLSQINLKQDSNKTGNAITLTYFNAHSGSTYSGTSPIVVTGSVISLDSTTNKSITKTQARADTVTKLHNGTMSTWDYNALLFARGVENATWDDTVRFNTSIRSYTTLSLTSNRTVKVATTGKHNGAHEMIRITTDGTHTLTLTNCVQASTSLSFANTNALVQDIFFWYDGTDAYYSIVQHP
jgi:hypothetical protein